LPSREKLGRMSLVSSPVILRGLPPSALIVKIELCPCS
jgi:hypothetical protein